MKYKQSTREYKKKIPVEARFSAPVQTGSGAHQAFYTVGTGFFPLGGGVKQPEHGVNHPPPFNAEVYCVCNFVRIVFVVLSVVYGFECV